MALKVGGTDLRPSLRLSALLPGGAQALTKAEWTYQVDAYESDIAAFRGDFNFVQMRWGSMTTKIHNLHHEFTAGDYHWNDPANLHDHIAIQYVPPGFGMYWSGQSAWASHGAKVDGVQLLADPNLPPALAHVWEVVDGDAEGLTSSQIYSREPITPPTTIKWRWELIEALFSPPGNFRRDSLGNFVPLGPTADNPTGQYFKWKASNEINGVPRDVAYFYLPVGVDGMSTTVFSIVQEWFVDFALGQLLDDNHTDVKYSGLRVYSAPENRWYELTEWRNVRELATEDPEGPGVGVEPWSAPELAANPHGFHAGIAPGKITVRTQVGLHAIGKQILSGLTYRRSVGPAALPFSVLEENKIAGVNSFTGTTFATGVGALPWILQDTTRCYYVLHPDADDDAILVYIAPASGRYRIRGDFARANSAQNNGDGVICSVVSHDTPFSLPIGANHPAVVGTGHDIFDNPANTGKVHFDIQDYPLGVGEEVQFVVSRGAGVDFGFDATAFRVDISYVEDPPPVPPVPVPWRRHRPRSFRGWRG